MASKKERSIVTIFLVLSFVVLLVAIAKIMDPCRFEGSFFYVFSFSSEKECDSKTQHLDDNTLPIIASRQFAFTGKEKPFCVNLIELGHHGYIFDSGTISRGADAFTGDDESGDDCNLDQKKTTVSEKKICTYWDGRENQTCTVRFAGSAVKEQRK
ncbi:MAG: hypothetical protein KA099_04055 [Alphaproteobacteria bacterium]|nr:hypothetical protein [Alphaproteobacteria bacterium]MBP7904481.1 hypothetical protein [Alphaproteobacteria bacterium]